jgi:protocatechuate 3,4-dioxygenase beta subunit
MAGGRARFSRSLRRVGLGLILAASLGLCGGALVGAPALASGETGGSLSETGTSPTGTGTSNCPSSNPPNQLTLVAGTPQTATLQSAFASGLQVALTNSDGCPVTSAAAGVPVTFSAPSGGASGIFAASGSNVVTTGADASGMVAAPTFTANDTPGSYTLTASSPYGSVSFTLTNTAAGVPARILALPLKRGSASVMSRYPQPLQVRVVDAGGTPVAGVTVTFTLGVGNASGCGTSATAGASFTGGGTQASAMTAASGVASSPPLTANGAAGSFTATVTLSDGAAAGSGSGGPAGSPTTTPVSFTLSNLAGTPTKLTTGVGSTQSAPAGAPFPIRLAVTVTDPAKNPVPDAPVVFSAPAAGASGRFAGRSSLAHARGSHRRRARVSHPSTVEVKTNACGIAVAPVFTANHQPGGYIVKASVRHARPAAFALVNEAPGQSP